MDATHRAEMATLMRHVLNALYAMRPQLVTSAASSRGADDRENTEQGRNGEPWGRLPAETYTTIVAGLSVATVDHLHGCAQIMLDDVDFGPGVMARCTLEAAGRLTWLLDPDLGFRDRVGRGYALRVRGLRDNARNIAALADAEPKAGPELVAAAEIAAKRWPEVIATAHELGFQTERHPETREFTGLVGLKPLTDSAYGFEAIRHLDVPPLGAVYAQWSGMAHSTYDALRNHVLAVNADKGLIQIGTTNASRIIAAGLATIGALHALDHTIVYFGAPDPTPRLALETEVLPATKQLFLAAIDANAAVAGSD
jgi:hypothetical protein